MAYGNYAKKFKKMGRKPFRKGGKRPRAAVKKLSADVRLLKRKVAGEKKTFTDGLIVASPVGQCNVNASSAWTQDLTPRPPTGTGYSERVGRSIKLVSMSVQYQISQQVNAINPIDIEIYIVRIVGAPGNVTTLYNNFKQINPITGVTDLMSTRDLNFFKDYRVIKKIKVYLKQDQISGGQSIVTGRVNMKLNQYINFDQDTTTVTDGQLCMFAYASTGNSGGSNSTLPNVINQNYASGAVIQTYTKFWYEDN